MCRKLYQSNRRIQYKKNYWLSGSGGEPGNVKRIPKQQRQTRLSWDVIGKTHLSFKHVYNSMIHINQMYFINNLMNINLKYIKSTYINYKCYVQNITDSGRLCTYKLSELTGHLRNAVFSVISHCYIITCKSTAIKSLQLFNI